MPPSKASSTTGLTRRNFAANTAFPFSCSKPRAAAGRCAASPRCPSRQPERLKARPAAPDCNGRVQVHRERGRCKLATLKAIPQRRRVSADDCQPTDISEPHARETKRAGPERAFERDAPKVQRAAAHSMLLRALTRERRAGTRREPRTPRLQPRLTNRRSSGASRRAPLSLSGVPPQVRHLLPAVEARRTGCPPSGGT
jgi:hypothetical protein